MRVGITGASGFIGSHLLRALERQADVVAAAFRRPRPARPPGVQDLIPFVKDKDIIYHLAGVNRGGDADLIEGNIMGTFNLIRAVQAAGQPARIIFASSAQVYKPPRTALPLRETHTAQPATLYGVCKKTAEDLIRLSGLDYTLLRLTNVYGPGCRPNYNSVVATFCRRAADGLPLTVSGNGRQGRDFIYIDDVVRAFLLAATRRGKPSAYNVGSGRVTSLRTILQNIRRILPDTQVTYRTETVGDETSYCCDNSRFMKQYGWKTRTSLRKGIEITLAHARQKTNP
ncbi:MAG: NAD-dependent epimerase/dehydratase family protein [Nitrospinales bacterium]